MLHAHLSFSQRYEHVPISLEQIQSIEGELKLRYSLQIAGLELRFRNPRPIDDVYAPKWPQFSQLWIKYPEHIRKFSVTFSAEKVNSRADAVCVDIFVRNQGHFGEAHEKEIILSSHNCEKYDFEAFCAICEKALFLRKAPASGYDMPHGRLMDRIHSSVDHPVLLNSIRGPLSSKDYDGAIRSATVLVEDILRKRCLAEGRVDASTQTGADLAVTAFSGMTACLTPPWPLATQARDGAHLILRGFFLYIRNAWGHNAVVSGSDGTMVVDHILLCQYLLKMIENSSKR
jgi:hypothetical protein